MGHTNININHPSFAMFLEKITNTILSNFATENYFSLSNEKKTNIQYLTLKLMKNSLIASQKLSANEIKSFVIVLMKKNDEIENYEISAILKDILSNFDIINELTNDQKNVTNSKKNKKIET